MRVVNALLLAWFLFCCGLIGYAAGNVSDRWSADQLQQGEKK